MTRIFAAAALFGLTLSLGACSIFESSEPPMSKSRLNLESNREFLDANKAKSGVMTTPSGLQYRVITEGGGARPGPTSTVTVHYRGTLIDGKEFDSSIGGQPISFPLNRVIKGWTEGLQLMTEGSKYELVIPSDLGYGARGAGEDIPPNQTLIFEVELLKVQ